MISTRRILIGLLALLVTTEPMMAIPTNRFRSAYKTIRTDIRCLFGNEKIDDPEQKKRIMIEIAAGITIMFATATVIWIWWVRPLKQELKRTADEPFQNVVPIDTSTSNHRSLQHIFRHGTKTFLKKIVDETASGDLSKLDNDGSSVLHYAASRDLPEVIEKLIEKKLEVNKKNNEGYTPLHFAAFSNQKEAINSLLKKEANPTLINKNGETPRQVAGNKGIQDILEQAEQEWAKKDKK